MLKLIARRVWRTIPTLLGIVLIAMLLLELMPGDPAAIMAGEEATPEAIQAIREDLNLDEPLWERFGSYLWGVMHGDLGTSPGGNIDVGDRIANALPVTLSLMLVAMVLAVSIGITFGTAAALWRGRLLDRVVVGSASVMQAMPSFILGLALVIFFAVDRGWFPTTGYVPLGEDPWEWLRHLLLPALALSMLAAAELARQTRGALADTLEQDYIRAARAKGLSERWVMGKHVAKNAATPVVTVMGLRVAGLLGGTVVVERIFGLHGFGSLAVSAVTTRDMVLIQGVTLVSAFAVLITNLLVDLSYGYFNPRTRVSS